MRKFERLTAVAAPLMIANIDTGALAPSEWGRDNPNNLGPGLLLEMRQTPAGVACPDFVLNQSRYQGCAILLAGPNFGCGSSRETAVWALMQYGIVCVIAPSFGDIFRDNAYQNGLLPIELSATDVRSLATAMETAAAPLLTVDLETQTIDSPAGVFSFSTPSDRRAALLEGLDETLWLRRCEEEIADFRRNDQLLRPWLYGETASA